MRNYNLGSRIVKSTRKVGLALSTLVFCTVAAAAEQPRTTGFYKETPLFSAPNETALLANIDRFGPVGMEIELHQPAFVMKIKSIEAGSPAAATGKLKAGQTIETINGRKLADIDPRIQLGKIITDAEAADGVVKFMVSDKPGAAAEEVIVRIPVLGAYSKTWPLNCEKSAKIVRAYGDFLATKESGGSGLEGFQLLFLLSTGEDKDLETARKWIGKIVASCKAGKGVSNYAWFIGISGTPMCEYYLRTGDASVLPVIQAYADNARANQTRGGWAGRGGQASVTYGGGGGHLNAGGTAVVTFLCLAKECGVNVDERTLLSAVEHFYRFAGRGNVPYGDNRPETGFVDNGKNGNLALAMAAAASLTGDGENSIYARARDAAATTCFYNTSFMLHGHTGGGIGEVWRGAAIGLLREKSPAKYRELMDKRQWIYELSRRYTGSFGIVGGGGYDNETWGGGLPLTYTMPRKKLRITGAPKTPYSKEYALPARPWGVEADDVFESLEAPADKDGNKLDLSKETLANDACKAVLRRLTVPGDVSDDLLRKYAHHQDHEIRKIATRKVMGANSGYLGWKSRGGEVKLGLMVELLKDRDPRVRQAAIDGLIYGLTTDKRDVEAEVEIDPSKYFTREIFDLLIGMIKDPAESWWVKDHALRALQFATADMLVPHVDMILPYLQNKDWWFQNAALEALTVVAADERCYKKVLPAVGELMRTADAFNALGPIKGISEAIQNGGPEVQKFAANVLGTSFDTFAMPKVSPGGQDLTGAYNRHLEVVARSLAEVPGGHDKLYELAAKRFPSQVLPYKQYYLGADPNRFGPKLREAMGSIIVNELVPEFVGLNWTKLRGEAAWEKAGKGGKFAVGSVDGLAGLYRNANIHDYDWHAFGPGRTEMKWDYHSFDPKETALWIPGETRYRKVTWPAGMESWYAPDFDPAKAGWKTGTAPFGQVDGKPEPLGTSCKQPHCLCSDPPKTLWENEVLLMRGTFEFPPMKDGYRYRLLIGGSSHVNGGDGVAIYVNGKLFHQDPSGVGKRQGGQPRGTFIDRDVAKEFQNGKVCIAAVAFLQMHRKTKQKTGHFTIWLEEMRLPPIGSELLAKSATVVPMLTSAWQAKQDPESTEELGEEDKFSYDGKFVANPKVLGTWKTVTQVAKIDEFVPEAAEPATGKPGAKKPAPKKTGKSGRFSIAEVTFKDNGRTDNEMFVWSGDTLMDLSRYQALKMTFKKIGDSEYLFVEAGGFSKKNAAGWQSPLYVMTKPTK